VKPYLLVLFFLLLLVAGAFAASAQPAQLVALACFGVTQFQNCPSGGRPDNVIQASDGNFYGVSEVTQEGESNPQGGSVFKVTPSGQFTLLHTFPAGTNHNYPSGDLPGFLAEGSDGNLYGTTLYGGSDNGGVLFRISKTGTGFKIVHQFCSAANCADGQNPVGLIAISDGNLYGAASSGGAFSCGSIGGCGAIFKYDVAIGSYSVIHSLNYATDGAFPSGFIQAKDGNFYGIVAGAIYRVTTTGQYSLVLTLPQLHFLEIPVTQGVNGNLYGIFRVYGQAGSHLFSVGVDGSNFHKIADLPSSAVSNTRFVSASDGNLWGVSGNVVQISAGTGAVLQTFSFNGKNGSYPWSLIQAKDGTFAGTTAGGGTVSKGTPDGVVFTLNASLPPPSR
jgi:uncharacterized repeat protein (TIGR03803 family)